MKPNKNLNSNLNHNLDKIYTTTILESESALNKNKLFLAVFFSCVQDIDLSYLNKGFIL